MNALTERAMNQASENVKRLNPALFRLQGNNGAFLKPDAPRGNVERMAGIFVSRQDAPRKPKGMNRTEARFLGFLQALQREGVVAWVSDHEPMRLKLADGARYTPDFASIGRDGKLSFWEIKGFQREAAAVRIKVAAEKYPWATFTTVKWERQKWSFYHVGVRQ
jgi:hypothetical protein